MTLQTTRSSINVERPLSPPTSAPAPVVGAIVRTPIINHWRRRIVVDWPIDNLGAFHHLRAARTLRSLPVVGSGSRSCGGALLRHATAPVERGFNRETFFVLPRNLAPALVARAGVDETATGNLGDDLTSSTRRRSQIYS